MLAALSSDKFPWPVYIGFSNIIYVARWLVKQNRLVLISLSLKCSNVPTTNNHWFPYYQSNALILCTLQAPVKNEIADWFADFCTHYAIHQIASFLADYPVQCTTSRVKSTWYPGCETCPHQENENLSRSHKRTSQTLQWTSPVLPTTFRCSQALLKLSYVLSDSSRRFSGALESTCSYGGAFRMLQHMTYCIVKFWSSSNL